jgi:hypothetical protein
MKIPAPSFQTRDSLRLAILAGWVPALLLATLVAAQVALAAPSGWLAVDGNIRFNTLSGANFDWANSGSGAPTYVCPAGAVNLPGPGGLFNCGRPGAGSAPPVPPTLTPAASSDPSIISADFIADPITSDTGACGAGDPTLISGGSKNGDLITSYTATSGSILAKDDLSNVYAVSHTRADTGHPELYFAAERLDNNGDSHMDFEFMQSQIGLSLPCGGSFTGHRTEGDLLVAVDFTGGGTTAGASVYQWHCVADLPLPGVQPADGTVCDPSGATPPQHYEQILIPTFLTFTVNAVDVLCGGWVCRDKTGVTTTVVAHDFLEGGIDLAGIPFGGCFNSFLPHTRTAQSFSSALKDFAGPVGLHSCRNPAISSNSAPAATVPLGTTATDSVVVGNGGAGPVPTGTVTFYLCGPGQTTAGGCPAGGTQVGAAKTLAAGAATSDPSSATGTPGTYCWRTVYSPDSGSTGIFVPGTHTNATSECFGVAAATPGLPNTGVPLTAHWPALPWGGLSLVLILPLALVVRRTRAAAVLGLALVAAALVPDVAVTPDGAPMANSLPLAALHNQVGTAAPAPSVDVVAAATMKAHPGWRLVIPSIGVDALIERVGLDGQGAMAAPARLDGVGWYGSGPLPGQSGDAVLDGHLGLPWAPGVFGDLGRLRPGDTFFVIWPDGHRLQFRIASSLRVSAAAPVPPGLFDRGGPSRVSLITCAGSWIQGKATYSERLVISAALA